MIFQAPRDVAYEYGPPLGRRWQGTESTPNGRAHAAFAGYKKSGIGRETHKMMLDHYQQTKNLLISYDTQPLGLF